MSIKIGNNIIETDEEGYLINPEFCKLAGLPKPAEELAG